MELSISELSSMQKILFFLSFDDFSKNEIISLFATYDNLDGLTMGAINNIKNINIKITYDTLITKSLLLLHNISFISVFGNKFKINPVIKNILDERKQNYKQQFSLIASTIEKNKSYGFENIIKIIEEKQNENY